MSALGHKLTLFWITQQILSVVSLGVGYVLAFCLSAAAIAASSQYLTLGHDLHSLSEAGQTVRGGGRRLKVIYHDALGVPLPA